MKIPNRKRINAIKQKYPNILQIIDVYLVTIRSLQKQYREKYIIILENALRELK